MDFYKIVQNYKYWRCSCQYFFDFSLPSSQPSDI